MSIVSPLDFLHKTKDVFLNTFNRDPERGSKVLFSIGSSVPKSKEAMDLVKNPHNLDTITKEKIKDALGEEAVNYFVKQKNLKRVQLKSTEISGISGNYSDSLATVSALAETLKHFDIKASRGQAFSEQYIQEDYRSHKKIEKVLLMIAEDEEQQNTDEKRGRLLLGVLISGAITSLTIGLSILLKKLGSAFTKAGITEILKGMGEASIEFLKRFKLYLLAIGLIWASVTIVLATLSKLSKERGIVS